MHAKPPPTFLLPEIVTFMTVLSSTPRTYCSTRPRPLTTPSKGRSVSPFLVIHRHVEISHGGERGPAGIVCSSPRPAAPLIASTYRPNALAIHIYAPNSRAATGRLQGGQRRDYGCGGASCLLLPLLPALAAATASPAATLAGALPTLLVVVAVGGEGVAGAKGERGGDEAVGEVDLGADGVGEVGDDEDVLDVVVEVALDVLGVDLGGEAQSVHEELAEGRRGLGLLVDHVVNVGGDALEHLEDVGDGALESLEIGDDGLRAVLAVLGRRDELQAGLLGLAVLELVRDGDEEARVGGALGSHADGGADVGAALDLLAGLGADRQVDGRVGPGAVALLAVEVLDEGGEGVEVAAGGIPADEDLAGVGAQVQLQHLLLVVHVDLDLLGRLRVRHGIAVADLDLGAVLAAGA